MPLRGGETIGRASFGADNPHGQLCLGLLHVGIGAVEVAEHVTGAAYELDLLFLAGHSGTGS